MGRLRLFLICTLVMALALAGFTYIRANARKPEVLPYVTRGLTYSEHNARWFYRGDKKLQPRSRPTPEQNFEMYFTPTSRISVDRQTGTVVVNRIPGWKPPFDYLRLAVAWNELEPKARQHLEGQAKFDFTNHDKIIQIGQEHPVTLVQTVGLKGLYYPEHYFPEQHDPGGEDDEEREIGPDDPAAKALLNFVTVMVNRYKNGYEDKARGIKLKPIHDWQIENEPRETTGDGPRTRISQALLAKEVALVRRLDPEARIWLTMGSGLTDTDLLEDETTRRWQLIADQLCDLKPDFIGINTYMQGYAVGEWEFKTNKQKWNHVRNEIINRIKDRGIRVVNVEFQAMPWEDDPSKFNIYNPTGNRSLTPIQVATIAKWVDDMGTEGGWPFGMEFANVCLVNGNPGWREAIDAALARPLPKDSVVH